MEIEQNRTTSDSTPRREMGNVPASIIATLVSLTLMLALVAGCDAVVFSR